MLRSNMKVILVFLYASLGCSSRTISSTKSSMPERHIAEMQQAKMIRLDDMRPLTLLEYVQRSNKDYVMVDGVYEGWIRDADVPELQRRIGDPTPCAFIISSVSSQLPITQSTVGHQAVFILYGYWKGHFPPESSSERARYDDPNEILDLLARHVDPP